jgi:acyl-CoA reductase-like NAD-dependent aldehyde dehydrogenase
MAERFKNYLGGKWIDSSNDTTFDDVNPANRSDVLGVFPRSDHRDVDRALEAAQALSAQWGRVPAIRRAETLYGAAGILADRKEELAAVLTREMGKVLPEASLELENCIGLLRYIAGEGCRFRGAIVSREHPDAPAMAIPVPLGIAAVISHWAFSLAGALWQLAPALAAGNTVVFKPAEDAPLIATRLVEILLEAGLPPGVVSLVHGYGEEAGAPLVRHPDVALVSFAGSPEVGRETAIACAAEQRRVSLDLGEMCAILVLEDADLDVAVEGAVRAGFAMSGQRWRGATRLLVHRKIMKEFAERAVTRVQAMRLGDGLQSTTDLGPIVNDTHLKRMHGQTRIGLREGAKLLCGGEVYKEGECKRGFFYAPTVFGDAGPRMRIMQEEVMGPAMVLVPVSGLEEALEIANSVRHRLVAPVYTRDPAKGFRAIEGLRAGLVAVNPASVDGMGRSSWAEFGRPGTSDLDGATPLLAGFADWKAATFDSLAKRQPASREGH